MEADRKNEALSMNENSEIQQKFDLCSRLKPLILHLALVYGGQQHLVTKVESR
jgi:hypothetical protein